MKPYLILSAFLLTLAAIAQPVISLQPTNEVIVGGTTAKIRVTVGDSGPLIYEWQFNNTNLPLNSIITTVAGNGAGYYSGDGLPATNAAISGPLGVAVDNSGNLFISDSGNGRIRKIDTNGIITTVAGLGNYYYNRFSGDGGSATNAYIYYPYGVAVDNLGNLFFADTGNQRIRKVDTNGIISTVAGNGIASFYGDGAAATNAALYSPIGIAVDTMGNLFIADSGNNRIRKVDANGIITTVAGNGGGYYSGDGGASINASLLSPNGVSVDASGNLFISDTGNHRIRKVTTNGIMTTVSGGSAGFSGDGGAATNANLYFPFCTAIDSGGNLIISDAANYRIRRIDSNGNITTLAGYGYPNFNGDGGSPTNASINPSALTTDAEGNVYIADANNRIRKVSGASYLPTLAIDSISQTNAGNYSVVITSSSGSVTSNVAKLLVVPASISQEPQSQVVSWGDTASFSISASSGSPFTYQWFFNNPSMQTTAGAVALAIYGNVYGATVTNGGSGYTTVPNVKIVGGGGVGAVATAVVSNGMVTAINLVNYGSGYTNLPSIVIDPPNGLLIGQTNMALNLITISPANTGNYYVVLSNNFASSTSSVASLAVVPILVSQEPQDQLVQTSSNASFTVTAAGAQPLAYQWYYKNSVLQTLARATAETYYGFVYGATVTDGGSGYTTVPQVQFVGGGGIGASGVATISNGMVTAIIVTNAGFGYTSLPAVVIEAPNGLLPGATNATLMLNAVSTNSAGNYFVIITNIYGSVTSDIGGLVIAYPPKIVQQPQSQTIVPGANATFSVTSTGSAPMNYQWWQVAGLQSNATASPFIINGFVLATTISAGGMGYLTPPAVRFIGGSGSGAIGSAIISNGAVTAVNIINPGSGYFVPPTVQIAPPAALSLPLQTNSQLTLKSVTAGNLGNYFVVVMNNFGSVTSSIANLTFAGAAPQTLSLLSSGGGLRIQLTGTPNQPFILQSATNLVPPIVWQSLVTNNTDGSGTWSILITNTTLVPLQFYRAVGP